MTHLISYKSDTSGGACELLIGLSANSQHQKSKTSAESCLCETYTSVERQHKYHCRSIAAAEARNSFRNSDFLAGSPAATMVSLYDLSVPVYIRSLQNLSDVLKVGEKWASENNVELDKLLEAKLAPDMKVWLFDH